MTRFLTTRRVMKLERCSGGSSMASAFDIAGRLKG